MDWSERSSERWPYHEVGHGISCGMVNSAWKLARTWSRSAWPAPRSNEKHEHSEEKIVSKNMQEQVRDAPRSSETLRAYSIYALCPSSELTIYMLSMLSILYIDLCHLCYTFFVFVFRDQGTNDS